MAHMGGTAPCLTVQSVEWDDTNGCFNNDFYSSSSPTFMEKINPSSILDFDAFTLSWKPLKGLRSHDVSTGLDEAETIVL